MTAEASPSGPTERSISGMSQAELWAPLHHEAIRKAICDELNCAPTHGQQIGTTCDDLATAAVEAMEGKR